MSFNRKAPLQRRTPLKTSGPRRKNSKPITWRDIEKECDRLMSLLVRARAGQRCEYPGCSRTTNLQHHHIVSRSYKPIRHDQANALCLCYGHHNFTAHGRELEFKDYLIERFGQRHLIELDLGARPERLGLPRWNSPRDYPPVLERLRAEAAEMGIS